ncbi:MAG: hypothetical protein M1835_007426 [Candelina submexicana]|nr:MAG: hypothetical protein M1835_007426 [Candelina submexicana]
MQTPSAFAESSLRSTAPKCRRSAKNVRNSTGAFIRDSFTSYYAATLQGTRWASRMSTKSCLQDIYGIDTYSTGQQEHAQVLDAATGLTVMRDPDMVAEFEASKALRSLHLAPMTFGGRWEKVVQPHEEDEEESEAIYSDEDDGCSSDESDFRPASLLEEWKERLRELSEQSMELDHSGYETESEPEKDCSCEAGEPEGDYPNLNRDLRAYFANKRQKLDNECAAALLELGTGELSRSERKRKRAQRAASTDELPVTDAAPVTNGTGLKGGSATTDDPQNEPAEEEAPPKKRARTMRRKTKGKAPTATPSTPTASAASATNGGHRQRSRQLATTELPAAPYRTNGTRPVNPSPLRQSTSASDQGNEDASSMPPPARPNASPPNGARHSRPCSNGNGTGLQTPVNGGNHTEPSVNGVAREPENSEPVKTKSGRVSRPTAKLIGGRN